MKKIIFCFILTLINFDSYGIIIGEKLMNCESNRDGTYDNCVANTGDIKNNLLLNDNNILLNYSVNYNYSCRDNYNQYIGIKSILGEVVYFKYNESRLNIKSNGKLSIVDTNPRATFAAQFVKDCNLHIKSITVDLSRETVSNLIKDACFMGVLNSISSQAQVVLYVSQTLINNFGSISVDNLKYQLGSLKLVLESISQSQRNNIKITNQIKNIIGTQIDNNYPIGTVNYILNNNHLFSGDPIVLNNSLNILYSNISLVMADVIDTSVGTIRSIYERGAIISDIKKFKSASLPLSNLKYQYAIFNGEDTSSFKAPICSN